MQKRLGGCQHSHWKYTNVDQSGNVASADEEIEYSSVKSCFNVDLRSGMRIKSLINSLITCSFFTVGVNTLM